MQTLTEFKDLLATFDRTRSESLINFQPLQGDASSRRYVRLFFSAKETLEQSSAILMLLADGKGPIFGGDQTVDQNRSFVELGRFFERSQIPCPSIWHADLERKFILVEDLGDKALWRDFSADNLKQCFKIMAQLSRLVDDGNCVAFRRFLGPKELEIEALRFVDHFLIPASAPEELVGLAQELIKWLVKQLSELKPILIHRDFMAWNVQIDNAGKARLIDFQDACLGPPLYDLAALLHDRDFDQQLGLKRLQLYETSRTILAKSIFGKEDSSDFDLAFQLCLLQRSLRLAGQFKMLADKLGKQHYRAWIPGCLKRIGVTLKQLNPDSKILRELSGFVPEIKEALP